MSGNFQKKFTKFPGDIKFYTFSKCINLCGLQNYYNDTISNIFRVSLYTFIISYRTFTEIVKTSSF